MRIFPTRDSGPYDITNKARITESQGEDCVHAGSAFLVSVAQDIAASANLDLLFVTPNTTKWAHLTLTVQVEGEMILYVYEDTDSTGGAAVTAHNRNRNSGTSSVLTVTSGPTVTTPGTTILSAILGSGNRTGGGAEEGGDIVLKQNTKYLFRITNTIAQAKWVSLIITWCEYTNA